MSEEAWPANFFERHMTTTEAKPYLFEMFGPSCADCAVPLAHPSLPETVIPHYLGYADEMGWLTRPGFEWAEVDHVIPKVAGGRSCIANYDLVCGSCNRARYLAWARRAS